MLYSKKVSFKRSLITKLIVYYAILIYIPLIVGGVLFVYMVNKNTTENYLFSVEKHLIQLALTINRQISDIYIYIDSLVSDKAIIDILSYDKLEHREIVNQLNDNLLPRLEKAIAYNHNIINVRLLHANRNIFTVYDKIYYNQDIATGEFENKLSTLSPDNIYRKNATYIEFKPVSNCYVNYSLKKIYKNVWHIYRPIYNNTYNKLNGVLEITIANETICSPLNDYNLDQDGSIQLLHNEYDIIYNSNSRFKGLAFEEVNTLSNNKIVSIEGKQYFMQKHFISSLQCWLVHYIPTHLVYLKPTTIAMFVGILFFLLICFGALSFLVSKKTLNNLKILAETMNTISSTGTSIKTSIESNDEIGVLSNILNNMLDRLDESKQKEKQLLYQQLSHQIRPHLLCNALDMIRLKSELRNENDIALAISSICRYCQYAFQVNKNETSLREELANTINYINITNIIRESPIELIIDYEKANDLLELIKIPKFTLQPIIENCIIHGFKNKKSKCVISIKISTLENILTIDIQDNGAGMTVERKNQILKELSLEHMKEENSIGLTNTLKRLTFHYGSECKMHIESYENAGTIVTLILPLNIY